MGEGNVLSTFLQGSFHCKNSLCLGPCLQRGDLMHSWFDLGEDTFEGCCITHFQAGVEYEYRRESGGLAICSFGYLVLIFFGDSC